MKPSGKCFQMEDAFFISFRYLIMCYSMRTVNLICLFLSMLLPILSANYPYPQPPNHNFEFRPRFPLGFFQDQISSQSYSSDSSGQTLPSLSRSSTTQTVNSQIVKAKKPDPPKTGVVNYMRLLPNEELKIDNNKGIKVGSSHPTMATSMPSLSGQNSPQRPYLTVQSTPKQSTSVSSTQARPRSRIQSRPQLTVQQRKAQQRRRFEQLLRSIFESQRQFQLNSQNRQESTNRQQVRRQINPRRTINYQSQQNEDEDQQIQDPVQESQQAETDEIF